MKLSSIFSKPISRRSFLGAGVQALITAGLPAPLAKRALEAGRKGQLYILIDPRLESGGARFAEKLRYAESIIRSSVSGPVKVLRNPQSGWAGWYPLAAPIRPDELARLIDGREVDDDNQSNDRHNNYGHFESQFDAMQRRIDNASEQLNDPKSRAAMSDSYRAHLEKEIRNAKEYISGCRVNIVVKGLPTWCRVTDDPDVAKQFATMEGTGDLVLDWWNSYNSGGNTPSDQSFTYEEMKHLLNKDALPPEGGWRLSKGQINKMTEKQYRDYDESWDEYYERQWEAERRERAMSKIRPSYDDRLANPMHQSFENFDRRLGVVLESICSDR